MKLGLQEAQLHGDLSAQCNEISSQTGHYHLTLLLSCALPNGWPPPASVLGTVPHKVITNKNPDDMRELSTHLALGLSWSCLLSSAFLYFAAQNGYCQDDLMFLVGQGYWLLQQCPIAEIASFTSCYCFCGFFPFPSSLHRHRHAEP